MVTRREQKGRVVRGKPAKGMLKGSDAHSTGGYLVPARHAKKVTKKLNSRRSLFGS